MVGTIDAKGIRDINSNQKVSAYVLTGSEFTVAGQPAAIGISANGDFTAYPTGVSAGNGTLVQPGKWGISVGAVASTKSGKFIVAGTAPTTGSAAITSGAYLIAISATGSILATATKASYHTGSQFGGLGLLSSALFDTAGGVIIF